MVLTRGRTRKQNLHREGPGPLVPGRAAGPSLPCPARPCPGTHWSLAPGAGLVSTLYSLSTSCCCGDRRGVGAGGGGRRARAARAAPRYLQDGHVGDAVQGAHQVGLDEQVLLAGQLRAGGHGRAPGGCPDPRPPRLPTPARGRGRSRRPPAPAPVRDAPGPAPAGRRAGLGPAASGCRSPAARARRAARRGPWRGPRRHRNVRARARRGRNSTAAEPRDTMAKQGRRSVRTFIGGGGRGPVTWARRAPRTGAAAPPPGPRCSRAAPTPRAPPTGSTPARAPPTTLRGHARRHFRPRHTGVTRIPRPGPTETRAHTPAPPPATAAPGQRGPSVPRHSHRHQPCCGPGPAGPVPGAAALPPCSPRPGAGTLRGAAVQVPQVVQLVRQLDQLGAAAAAGSALDLQPLALHLGQALVVRHLLHHAPHLRTEPLLDLRERGVRVLHCVVQQGGLRRAGDEGTAGLGPSGGERAGQGGQDRVGQGRAGVTCSTTMSVTPASCARILATAAARTERWEEAAGNRQLRARTRGLRRTVGSEASPRPALGRAHPAGTSCAVGLWLGRQEGPRGWQCPPGGTVPWPGRCGCDTGAPQQLPRAPGTAGQQGGGSHT